MMSLSTIRHMSEEAGRKAAQRNMQPYVPYNEEDVQRMPGGELWNGKRGYPFPSLGDHQPEGWTDTGESYFVDSSGLGRDYEPALTWPQFNKRIIEDVVRSPRRLGLGITEVGQFQLYVSVFERDE